MSKIDLKDLTFCIALKVDSEDRLRNLDIVIKYLTNTLDTNIILSELSNKPILKEKYVTSNPLVVYTETSDFFNRQKALNIAVKNSNTDYIIHYDADVLFHPIQLLFSLNMLKGNQCDMIYPYNGHFYDVPKQYHNIQNESDLQNIDISRCRLFNSHSVGGAVMFKKDIFIKGGMANELFFSVGYEDNEINTRFSKLEYRISRSDGVLYHLNHERKETSFDFNPYINNNLKEFKRIESLSLEQLKNEINLWNWCKLERNNNEISN